MDSIEPKSLDELEAWLEQNHNTSSSVWLILAKKDSGLPYLAVDEVIDTALCYGWIDSLPNKIDDKRFKLRISPRSPKSNWSMVNKQKVERLIRDGRMKAAGLVMVELAKTSGTWHALDDVESLIIPEEMKALFNEYPGAEEHFNAFPRSVKRGILEWIYSAKKPETREKRIRETVSLAQQNVRANQYIRK